MFSAFLDLRTLSLVLLIITAVLGMAMLFIGRTNKTYKGYNLWAISNLMIAIGFCFLSLRGIVPSLFSVTIGNTMALIGVLLAFEGNIRFLGLRSWKWFSLAVLILHITTHAYFTYFYPSTIVRIVLLSGLLSIISFGSALAFYYRKKEEDSLIYKFAGGTYAVFGILMIMRAVLTFSFSNITDLYAPDWIQSTTFLIFVIFSIIWTHNYLMLNNERLHQELAQIQSKLQQQATTDFLTGLKNNRYFFEIGNNEIQRSNRFDNSLSVIMFDIDHFKSVNDNYGHSSGDVVLKTIAELCKNNLRSIDTVARLGGEEFAILLPHTDLRDAKAVAEYLRVFIEKQEVENLSKKIKVTASFGVAELIDGDVEIKDLLDRADTALYQAKYNGRNLVVCDYRIKKSGRKLAIA